MANEFRVPTPYATITATWHRSGRNIVVCYGEREKVAQASDEDAVNEFVARNIVEGWIAADLGEPEDD